MKSWRLATAVFLCGAVVMAFELAGSRVMAPVVGTSLTAWTAIIGIVLASLSAGYWLGGRMADRHPEPSRLVVLIAAAAAAISVTALMHVLVMAVIGWLISDIRISAPLGAFILFAPAATLLGMVTPYAAKLRISDLSTDGRTVGTLAALSTGGSIAGTFLAGYLLIPILGTTTTLVVLALTAGTAALLVLPSRTVVLLTAGAILISIAAIQVARLPFRDGERVVMVDTRYSQVSVISMTEPKSGRPIRAMATDPFGIQAAQYTDSDEPVFEYIKFLRLAERLGAPMRDTLLVGGAAYTWPRDFLARNPDARMTVVEIDPGMTDIARRFFRLGDDARMHIVHEDGRIFLNRPAGPYDAIYLDAFSGTTIPFHLLTREAIARTRAALTPGGVVMANIIGSVEGPPSALLRAATATFRMQFPYVYLFPLGDGGPQHVRNVALVASARDLTDAFAQAGDPLDRGPLAPWEGDMSGGRILTDDHAPVELLSIPLLRR